MTRVTDYWTTLGLKSPKELDFKNLDEVSIWWNLDNYEEFDEVPEGKIAFADYVITEKLTGRLEYQFLLGLENADNANFILVMPLLSESAQHIIEPLCFLPENRLCGAVMAFHHYLYMPESHNYPEIRFRVQLDGRYFLNAPLSSFNLWLGSFCYKRLAQLQKKLDHPFPLGSDLDIDDIDF